LILISYSLVALLVMGAAQAAPSAKPAARFDPDPAIVSEVFPGVAGDIQLLRSDRAAPAWRVQDGDKLIGFIASTAEVSGSVGYSGQPLDVYVGISTEGKISGAVLVQHSEPVLTLGISDEDITKYVRGFSGYDLKSTGVEAFEDSSRLPPIIARATVSTGVIRDAILRTARTVALAENVAGMGKSGIDRASYEARTWQELVADGSITHVFMDLKEAGSRFGEIANPLPADDAPFVDLWVAVLDPPTIGQNLLGKQSYSRQMASLAPDEFALFIGGAGLHSHRGTAYLSGGYFDRLAVSQEGKHLPLKKENYIRLDKLAPPDAPVLNELSLFRLGAGTQIDPSKPLLIEVIAERERRDGSKASLRIPLTYELPGKYALQSGPVSTDAEPLWVSAWRRKPVTIAVVGVMVLLVAVIFFAQESFVRRPRLWLYTRTGFLLFTLIFLGWYANGQLSVVQVIAFLHSLLHGFRWETFLIEPVIFILWSFVALGLLFLGRGVYCGWLCPFGALQELLNEGAKRLGLRQVEVPFALQERLWAIKYTLFILILAISFYSMEKALVIAEVEPFKTAISMRFMREWPFVLFAVSLLTAGLFIERFFCRYLCPLGAALGIPAKSKLFDWLHRRPQCGRECRYCETQCTVGAIDTLGRINPNECVLCLRCQVIMCDAHQCIVLKRRNDRSAVGPGVRPSRPETEADETRREV
jgi:NosR/NirI family nitrite reductase transcriptional regulator